MVAAEFIMIPMYRFLYGLGLVDTFIEVLPSPAKAPLPLGLVLFQGTYTMDIPLTMTETIIIALPMLIFYFFFQGHIVRGLSQGAIK